MRNLEEIIPFQSCRFIPVSRVGQSGSHMISLGSLWLHREQIADILLPPVQRLAALRWLLLKDLAWGPPASSPMYGQSVFPDSFYPGALQCSDDLPATSARSSRDILEMRDGNNMALDPTPEPPPSVESDALALLVSYFCDRPGLKARVEGLPISGQCPLHMGRTTVFRAWDNLAEFVTLNRVGGTGDYLGHRWRRLQFAAKGRLVIAAGDQWSDLEYRDPWVLRKSHPSHIGKAITDEMVKDEKRAGALVRMLEVGQAIDITGVALQQASPLAIWQERGEVVAADT